MIGRTIAASCGSPRARPGATSTRSSAADDHWLPPDNFQEIAAADVAHRTSPTNIGMGLLADAGRARSRLHRRADELVERIEATLTTLEGLERFEGHLFNWYDSQTLAPLTPRYISSVDSGNLAAALLTLPSGLRQLRSDAQPSRAGCVSARDLASRACGALRRMNFRVPYDAQRGLCRDRLPPRRRRGPGPSRPAFYDLLASEARLASFIAIAKGDVPETHWFRLGRPITSVQGVPTLLSWGATLFEYLMPLLVMRSYPDTLLDETCRMAVRRQIEYGEERGVPWGISECAYNVVDRHGTYQYRAFGVPGLGLEARPGRRSGGRAVCDRAGGDARAAPRRRTCAGWPRRARRPVRLLRRRGLHVARRRPTAKASGARGERRRHVVRT